MKISIKLSEDSIEEAIDKLLEVKHELEMNVNEFVDILLMDGSEVANEAYGGMATAWGQRDDSGDISIANGHIGVGARNDDTAIIAEFGAGYATMEYHPFAKNAPVPIKVASYSKENDGLFWLTDDLYPGEGYWIFGWTHRSGKAVGEPIYYDRIQPKHGLLNAYDHIVQNYADIAKEVIKL